MKKLITMPGPRRRIRRARLEADPPAPAAAILDRERIDPAQIIERRRQELLDPVIAEIERQCKRARHIQDLFRGLDRGPAA